MLACPDFNVAVTKSSGEWKWQRAKKWSCAINCIMLKRLSSIIVV